MICGLFRRMRQAQHRWQAILRFDYASRACSNFTRLSLAARFSQFIFFFR